MRASLVIVNHNGGSGVVENLRFLAGQIAGSDVEIVVVDNASGDGSPEAIARELPSVRVAREPENRGYAAGVNRGLVEARGDAIVVLNPDIRPEPGALEALIDAALERREFTLLGGLVVDARGRVSPNCLRALPAPRDITREAFFLPPRRAVAVPEGRGVVDAPGEAGVVETEVVSGSVMALHRDALRDLGAMDDDFFLYREDVEWCRRAIEGGMKVGLVTGAGFVHEGGASTRRAEGPAFAARVLSDFHYFCRPGGESAKTIRRLWRRRLRLRAFLYGIDARFGPRGRRERSRRRRAIYRILAENLTAFRWSEADDGQSGAPARLADLPADSPSRGGGDRPTVLFVIPDMDHGGAQRRIEYLVTGALAERFRFEILCLRHAGALGRRLADRVKVHALELDRWTSPATWRRVADYCALLAPDLVHSATLPADVAAWVAFRARVPRIAAKVSVDTRLSAAGRALERFVLRGADVVYAVGDEIARAKSYLGRGGMLPPVIQNPPMIPIGQDPPRPFPSEGPVAVAYLGRLEPVKRADLFIELAAELERASPGRFSFTVIGEGSERAALEALAADRGIEGQVEFAGAVDDVASALDAVDVVPLLSAGEGRPNTVLETIARGRVPIVRRAGGAADSLPAALTGCLVDSSSPTDFARKIEDVARRSDWYLERVRSARAELAKQGGAFDEAMAGLYGSCLREGHADGRVRVLHLITRLIVGGAQENTIASVERVDPARYDSRLWLGPQTGSEGSLLADARARGIAARVLPKLVREISPWNDLVVTFQLVRLLRRARFDIVHTHSSKAGIVGRLAARIAGVPNIVHTAHGWGFHDYMNPALRRAYVTVEKIMEPWTRPLISVSTRTTSVGLAEAIGRPDSYRLIRSGIPLERFRPDQARRAEARERLGIPADAIVVGSVGRLSSQKNPLDFVRVAASLLERHPDLRFVYVGDGPLRVVVTDAIERAGVRDRVLLLGLRDDVPDLLCAFDLFVLTSLWEGLPRVVLQALATGVPVVAYDTAGIEEAVIDGTNGHLVPPGAVAAMVEKLDRLIDDGDARAALARAASGGFDASFTEDRMIRDLEDLYDELTGSDPRGSGRGDAAQDPR